MSGYVYEGHGLLLDVGNEVGFISAYESATGGAYEDLYEIENEGLIGDWCSPDNLTGVFFDGEPFDCTGCLVVRMEPGQEPGADLALLAEVYDTTVEQLIADNECDFYVTCQQ